MRGQWKESELVAFSLLAHALMARGITPMYCPEVVDSPDGLFIIEGQPVAIECRYIAHPKLLEFMGRRNLELTAPHEVVVPREPHLWVRDAIIDKNKNIEKYMANTGATEAWLLLHSSGYHSMLHNTDADETFKTLLTLGAHLIEHKFSRIWFSELGGSLGEAIEIYGPDIPNPSFDWDEYVKTFFPGYPLNTYWYIPSVVAQAEPDGEGSVTVNLNDPRGTATGLQPLDTRYKIDYSRLTDPERNANRTGLSVALYDAKPPY